MRGTEQLGGMILTRGVLRAGLLLAAALCVFTVNALAIPIPIPIASTGNSPFQTNTSPLVDPVMGNSATIPIDPHPAWGAPFDGSVWVSYGSTGNPNLQQNPGYYVVPNQTTVSFFDVFELPGDPIGGWLRVMADDSTAVYLNNTLLVPEATTVNNTYRTCSDFGIGCIPGTSGYLDLTPYLVSGTNTLRFDVSQRSGHAFGLNYSGGATSSVPEPGTISLMGLAALGVIGWRSLRWRNGQGRVGSD